MRNFIAKRYKVAIYFLLVSVMLAYSFVSGIRSGMHQCIPEAVGRHRTVIGIAISSLRYGLGGYRGYIRLDHILRDNGITNNEEILTRHGKGKEEILQDPEILNDAIKKAINADNVSSKGYYYLLRYDKGLSVFYRLAFKIFSYKVESFYYLYFLLLALSIYVFFATFHKRFDLLNVLLLFVCAHFVIMMSAPVVGIDVQTVHNVRFLSVLSILPSIYIALLILRNKRFTKPVLIGVLIQSLLIILALYARSSAKYQLMFLIAVFCFAGFWNWIRNPRLGKYALRSVRFWPLGIVFVVFFILKAHLALELNYPYDSANPGRTFWHMVYLGLGAHPDSKDKYGIEFDDKVVGIAVRKRLSKSYGEVIDYDRQISENILREECLNIVKKDPIFAIWNYLYKVPLFFRNYFSSSFGAIGYLFKWNVLFIVLLGSLTGYRVFLKQWFRYFWLFILGFAFASLPCMLAMPTPPLIADPAVLFTMAIYTTISGAMCLGVKRLSCLHNRKSIVSEKKGVS